MEEEDCDEVVSCQGEEISIHVFLCVGRGVFEGLYPLLYPPCKMQDLVEMYKNKKLLNSCIVFYVP